MLHIITDFSSTEGAQAMLARLLSVSAGERIAVVALQDVSARNREIIGNPHITFHSLNLRTPAGIPAAVARLTQIIGREKPDSILCWMYHAMALGSVAARLAGTNAPVFWTVRQALDDQQTFSRSTRIALAACRRLASHQSGIIYNSQRACDQHTSLGFPSTNCVVIPNGFAIPEMALSEARSPRIFGVAARFHPQKDYENFFTAASRVASSYSDTRFHVAGKGTTLHNPKVRELVERYPVPPGTLQLNGPLSGMDEFYSGIDALVISSRTEGFPNVAAEAMSHGKIVITTDVGDAAEIVADSGIVVPPGDPEALAGAMEWACNLSPNQYRERSMKARQKISECYALSEVYRRYTAFAGTSV